MAILRKNGLEVEVTPLELVEILKALDQKPVAEHINPVAAETAPAVQSIAPAPARSASKPAVAARRSVRRAGPIRKIRPTRTAHRSAEVDASRARSVLDSLARGPQQIRDFLIGRGAAGGNGEEIRRGVNRVQSDVSRSISALKQAESDAQVPAGSFVIVKKEGKLTRWYAGPLLASGNPSAAEPQPVKTQVQQPKVPSGLLGPLQFDDP